jgi:hypothetical protein
MADRIDKYRTDCARFAALPPVSAQKVRSELSSLNKWIVKHQQETVPDGDKAKLLATLQFYYKLVTGPDFGDVKEAVFQLLDDFLKLPEGKLVTAKGKQGVLRWQEVLATGGEAGAGTGVGVATSRYGVADISSGGVLSLMDLSTNSILDHTVTVSDKDLLDRVRICFDDLGYLEIVVQEGKVLQVFDMDGNEQDIIAGDASC